MRLHRRNESSDQLENGDLTDELVEWARSRGAAVPETMPDTLEPPQPAESEPEVDPSGSESTPSEVETAAPIKSKQQLKVLVVALDENAADRAQAYSFDDTHEALQFVETLVGAGFRADRILVFRCKPMSFNVTHRPVVTLGEPGQPAVSS